MHTSCKVQTVRSCEINYFLDKYIALKYISSFLGIVLPAEGGREFSGLNNPIFCEKFPIL